MTRPIESTARSTRSVAMTGRTVYSATANPNNRTRPQVPAQAQAQVQGGRKPNVDTAPASPARGRRFPDQVAVFSEDFVYTTLNEEDVAKHERVPYVHPRTLRECELFSIDDEMAYTPFANDHGPLNMAYTMQAFLRIFEVVQARENSPRPTKALCLYSDPNPKVKSNMVLIVALYYLVLYQKSPAECFKPIAAFEVMPFRDAGNGVFDHALSVQDCLYGISKARDVGLFNAHDFDAKEYRYYEVPSNGDLNHLGPFIPFASPYEPAWHKAMLPRWQAIKSAKEAGELPPPMRPVMKGRLTGNQAFKNVLDVFKRHQVGLVVRLNDELYDKRHFIDNGIDHVEMYFDDGTCPDDEMVRQFILVAEEYIGQGRKVAVHCKAGLGRTGVLIGAYFIYKYAFSAQEVLGFMRIIRPGMIVGVQQQYMLQNQMKWIGWAARDQLLRELSQKEPDSQLATPPNESDLDMPGSQVSNYSTLSDAETVMATRQLLSHNMSPQSTKRGDARGQPRKTPITPQTDIRPPTPESDLPDIPSIQHRAPTPITTTTTTTTDMSSSMRGTKRGARPSAQQVLQPPSNPRSALDLPDRLSYLERSPSIASTASANDRPRKRIHGIGGMGMGMTSSPLSPLSSLKGGQNNLVEDEEDMDKDDQSRTLRVHDGARYLSQVHAQSQLQSPSRIPPPTRRASPLREIPEHTQTQSQSQSHTDNTIRTPRLMPSTPTSKGKESVVEPRARRFVGAFTPPRFAGMFGRSQT